MPSKPGTLSAVSVYTYTLTELGYIKAKIAEMNKKARKSKRLNIAGNPALIDYLVKSYMKRFKHRGLPF